MLNSDGFSFRFDIGVTDSSSKLELCDRSQIVQSIATYYFIVRVKAHLDQMIEGLGVLGLHGLIKANPCAFRNMLMAAPVKLDADYILNLFITKFSDTGSNRRDVEEQTMMYWVHFIELIECKE